MSPKLLCKKLFVLFLLAFFSLAANAESVSITSNATTLTSTIAGSGVTITGEGLSSTGATQSGTFTGFNFLFNNQMDNGIILGTGNVTDAVNGPPTTNTLDDITTEFNGTSVNDPDLGGGVYDPVKLTFNVTPQFDTLIFDFVFGSDEYTEFVNGGFNDQMRIIVNGTDCALTPDGQVFSIDTVNETVNPPLFIKNDLNDGGATLATEMDGFTRLVSCRANVTPNVSIPIVVGASDDGDGEYDSWVFFRAQSLRSEPSSDFGDAPDTYGTLLASGGPRHTVVEGVFMGTTPTGEVDGFVDGIDDSAGAATDDANDDGVSTFPALTDVTTTYSVTVSASSINGASSNLIGWIDFDGDGAFQADEASNIAVVADGAFETPVVLTWNNIGTTGPDIVVGNTYARFRITNSAITTANTGGTFATGEVEDYALTITDGTPPVVVITSAPTATAANSAVYPVSGTCTVGDGDVTVSIAGATPASQAATCTGGGAWSTTFDVTAIADGTNVVDVDASQTDGAGNTGNATQVEADKDATVPVVATTSAPVANITNQATYLVSGTCTAGDGNVTVGIAGATPASQAVACSGGGTWGATFNVTAIADGSNVIDVNASQTDAAGNTGNAALVEANKDTTAPAVATTSAPVGTAANSATYPVSGTCTAGDGNVTVGIAGATPASQAIACSGGGTWSATFNVTAIADGTNVIDVSANQTDTAGNTTVAPLVEANKDATAPAVVISSAPTATVANSTTYPVSGTCTAGDGNVTVSIAGATPGSQGVACTGGGTWSATFDVSAISDGTNVIDVNASQTDTAGNTGNAVLVEADKDATAPAVATTSNPAANAANQAAYTVSGTCTAGDGNVTVGIVGATPASQAVACTAGGTWSAIFDVSAIADGTNVIDVTASQTDGAGNTTNATVVEADKDVVVPTVVIQNAPAAAATLAPYTVTFEFSEDVTGFVIGDVTVGNGVASNFVAVDGNTYTADITPNGNGDITIDVAVGVAQDAAANDNTAATQVSTTLATDGDGDGIPDSVECPTGPPFNATCQDSDGDGTPDYLDTDSDNDGIPDTVEGGADLNNPVDTDGDGTPDFQDLDSDGDGIPDAIEAGPVPSIPVDTDGDGTPDYLDLDADDDGIPDVVEGGASGVDTDGDGIDDVFDVDQTGGADANNDGVDDAVTPTDTDGDGTLDYLDLDSDNDGIPDTVEGGATGVDSDADGIDDAFDVDLTGGADVNGDGVDDNAIIDTDSDGTPDFQDLDSDNDGIPDAIEGGGSGVDTDADGIDDAFDVDQTGGTDANADGIDDNAGVDTDNDGTPDFQDLDSDNDGIPDAIEGGASGVDTDADGIDDTFDVDQTGGTDANGDGIDDAVTPRDTDSDGAFDYQDLDTDNDGIPDSLEADVTGVDTDSDGIDDLYDVDQTGGADANGDGVDDAVTPTDTDTDTVPDYRDLDSDNDSVPDIQESGGLDVNQDGLLDAGGTLAAAPLQDTDIDGTPDFRDLDSNNDGTNDILDAGNGAADVNNDGVVDDATDTEGDGVADVVDPDPTRFGVNADADGDGIPNSADLDDDNDGIPDTAELNAAGNSDVDTDGDGIVDRLDRDSDNDGLPDSVEAVIGTPVDADADGVVDNFVDANSDGLHDTVDPGLDPVDTDSDGTDDFRDIDSDGDGLTDVFEASGGNNTLDPNGDGMIDSPADADLDGLADVADPVVPGGTAGTALPNPDTDADGTPNFRDQDSDGDSIPDNVEAGPNPNNPVDTDSDGTPDVLDLDSDGDGIADSVEVGSDPNNPLDSDGDGIPDYQDADPVVPADTGKLETAVTGVGSFSVIGLLMLLIVTLMRFGGLKVLKRIAPIAGIAMLLAPVISQANTNYCGRHNPLASNDDNDFNPCFYVGVGGYTTHVDPEGNAGGWSTSDDSDSGFAIIGGWHFKPHWFGEISYADLGEAGLSNDNPAITNVETISYEIPSIHVGYLLREPENSFNVYGKLGVSFIDNEASSPSVPYEKQTDAQLTGGIGLQWRAQETGLFARLAADFYDRDVLAVGVVVGYNFGGSERTKVAEPEKSPGLRIDVIDHELGVVLAPPKDSDGDGYTDDVDQCPNTKPGVTVDEKGCEVKAATSLFTGVLEGVNFQSGSTTLTQGAKEILNDVAQQFKDNPEFKVVVVGYTDSQGSAKLNQKLSLERAKSVAAYMQQQGVASSQMTYEGRGEEQPRADNTTAEGRALNRRVELLPQ